MLHKVEIVTVEHQHTLQATLADWARQEHDVYLVSIEGHKLFSQKVLLGFYSPMLKEALSGLTNSWPGISVPSSSASLSSILHLLLHGQVVTSNQETSTAVMEAAADLGISLQNCASEGDAKKSSTCLKPETKDSKPDLAGLEVPGPVQ